MCSSTETSPRLIGVCTTIDSDSNIMLQQLLSTCPDFSVRKMLENQIEIQYNYEVMSSEERHENNIEVVEYDTIPISSETHTIAFGTMISEESYTFLLELQTFNFNNDLRNILIYAIYSTFDKVQMINAERCIDDGDEYDSLT